jgi:hypothetical protein
MKFKLFFKKDYWKNRVVVWLLALGFVANLANWIILAVFIKISGSTIILHYNVYFGVDVMDRPGWVFILPGVGLTLLLINNFLAMYFYANKERIASYVLLSAAFMAQLALQIAALSVIIINY